MITCVIASGGVLTGGWTLKYPGTGS
jgi:hypothetical protein